MLVCSGSVNESRRWGLLADSLRGGLLVVLAVRALWRTRTGVRVVGLDWGKARIGVAIADEMAYAHPRPAIDATRKKLALSLIAAMAKDEGVELFIVGLPVSLSGEEGRAAEGARLFAQDVANATGCDVELWDERMTTVQAKRELLASGISTKKHKDKIDSAAACLLLQSWLDSRSEEE